MVDWNHQLREVRNMKKQIAALGLCAAMVVGSATGCSTDVYKRQSSKLALEPIPNRLPTVEKKSPMKKARINGT